MTFPLLPVSKNIEKSSAVADDLIATSASSTPTLCGKALYASIIRVVMSSGIGVSMIILPCPNYR